MTAKAHVLIVEDEPVTRAKLAAYLTADGFQVSEAADAKDMKAAVARAIPDVVLLDINLPDESGLILARELRAKSSVGIILVTARQDETDRIVGLEIGADDYITKPFNPRELAVRVRNLQRRVAPSMAAERSATGIYSFAGWRLDCDARQLTSPTGEAVRLTRGEFDVLAALARNAGRALTRDQLLDLTQHDGEAVIDRTIDVLVGRLRRKIEGDSRHPSIILTVHGVGYRLVGG
ncbi:two-component system response regulator [Paramagnetospirillum kuznetsovii]|uniref:Regulatory protein VirG n=1 Tax=Paramagnetospirillum kuznetsovii TaxID=2053833 RepID=A0A364NVC2_9PROT|nr:response regulator [Paramagnetospirillum kuznetsovii]RAU21034.1 two-component system response regulator [Paramagnetospirillum kuznetsovii]